MNPIRGLAAYPITPADEAGVIDLAALRRLVRRLVEAGVDWIGLLGSTGTYPYLDRDQRGRAIKAAVDEARGRARVMAGVGALRTDAARALAHDALEAGADAGLLAPVSYTPLTDDEVFTHFARVAETGLPICIYNNPATTHFTFSPELTGRLAELPGMVAVKNPAPPAGPVSDHLADLRGRVPAGFSLGYSVDTNAVEALIAGGDAWHSVVGGLFPAEAAAITRAAMGGQPGEARRRSAALAPLYALSAELGGLRVVYAAANALGLVPAEPPRPILP
jgi:4-hydroxy-tetrahydrodipicolinate synthase